MYQYTAGLDHKMNQELSRRSRSRSCRRHKKHAWGDAGYQGVNKRQEMQGCMAQWHEAMRPGKRNAFDLQCESSTSCWTKTEAEHLKVSVCAKVGHPFRVIKQQFGYSKLR